MVESFLRAVLQWKMLSPNRRRVSSGATPRTKNRRRSGPCGAALFLMASAATLPCTESKICVETDIDIFLCTDDMATARQKAMKRNDEPLRFAGLGLDLGVEQRNDGQPHQQRKVSEHMTKVKEYFETVVLAEQKYDDVRDRCVNKHELCTFWAALTDECAKNPGYMLVDCAAACMSCDRFL